MPGIYGSSTRPPLARFDWKASFDTANAPHLVTLLRRIGLGFIPRPQDKLGTDDDEEIEDPDVGPIRASRLDLDI